MNQRIERLGELLVGAVLVILTGMATFSAASTVVSRPGPHDVSFWLGLAAVVVLLPFALLLAARLLNPSLRWQPGGILSPLALRIFGLAFAILGLVLWWEGVFRWTDAAFGVGLCAGCWSLARERATISASPAA
jgi:hypothetical protein